MLLVSWVQDGIAGMFAAFFSYFGAALNAACDAGAHTGKLLFRGFNLRHWLALGTVAWLTFAPQMAKPLTDIPMLLYRLINPVSTVPLGEMMTAAQEAQQRGDPSRLVELIIQSAKAEQQWAAEHQVFTFCMYAAFLVLVFAFWWLATIADLAFLAAVRGNAESLLTRGRRYLRHGTGLFACEVGAWTVIMLVPLALAVVVAATAATMLSAWLLVALVALGALLIGSFCTTMLTDIAGPLIVRYEIGTVQAVSHTSRLLWAHWFGMLVFWLMRGLLGFGARLLMAIVVVCTCGLPLLPLMLPIPPLTLSWQYVLAIVLLPVYVYFRALGPAFLAALNPAYSMLTPSLPEIDSDTPPASG
jgi:hypothetical protein